MKRLPVSFLACSLVLLFSLSVLSTGTAFASDGSGGRHHQKPIALKFSGTCSGNGCNGLFVGQTNCGNSTKQLQALPIYQNGTKTQIGTVRLWWSYTCGTNWAQAYATVSCSQVIEIYTEVHRVAGPDGGALSEYDHGVYGGCSDSSPMVYAPNECAWGWGEVVPNNGNPGDETTSCI